MNSKMGMVWVVVLGFFIPGCGGTNIGNGMVQVELSDSTESSSAGTMQAHTGGVHGEVPSDEQDGRDYVDPPDYEAVNVTLGAVQARYNGADGERWITLVADGGTHDLLTLQTDITAVLGEEAIPAGDYSELRMIVTSGNVVIDGQDYPLEIPSAAQTGIKIIRPFHVETDANYVMVIDFDAAKSIEVLGPTGEYLLEPVLSVRAFGEQ